MYIKRKCILIGFLVLSLVGCGESLGGQRFVSLDGSDWIEFTSNSRLETTVDSSVIEGEYRIENDGRLRMSFDHMGGNYVIYGTFNDDGGFTVTVSGNEAERYFKEDDPKLAAAFLPTETLIATNARYCRDSRCMGILPPVREVIVTNVDITYDRKLTVPFSKISELDLVDSRRNPAYGVAVRVDVDRFRVSMDAGWTEFRFDDINQRNAFYNKLGAALQEWHSRYGVRSIVHAAVTMPDSLSADTKVAEKSSAPRNSSTDSSRNGTVAQSRQRPSRSQPDIGQMSKAEAASRIQGRWYIAPRADEFSFESDGSLLVKGEQLGSYELVDGTRIRIIDSKNSVDEFEYEFHDELLIFFVGDPKNGMRFHRTKGVAASDNTSVILDQVSEGVLLSHNLKSKLLQFKLEYSRWPSSNEEVGLSGPYRLQGIDYASASIRDGGRIVVTFGENAEEEIRGRSVTVSRRDGDAGWVCSSSEIDSKYLPSKC